MLTVVCAALIKPDGRVLVQRRPEGGRYPSYWEFPGGKVERGEAPEAALVRELSEELGLDTDATHLTPLGFATESTEDGSLVLLLYISTVWRGVPRLLHATALDWVSPVAMRDLQMPPADRPLVEMLVNRALAKSEA